ncbi:metallophosphoesterase [Aeromicrobium sp. Marseille-Q0843]|uniref:Metallophosphoesterase n=1 Tax=Aeromicrobium phoceense TaxID=2754045 RepID=A0A838XHW9_9ACTN|nr:metallophosphoesterase [Aeromicrobium phoceense]MBA4608226.1 metallophosphoesterase [Aeromicrobium phoceense]
MVRVLVVADEISPVIHDAGVRRLRPDVVLGAGDLPWDYLEFLSSMLDVPVVFVPGNHDPAVEAPLSGFRGWLTSNGLPQEDPRPLGGVNADESVVDVAGLRIAGLGGSIRYNDGPNQYTQDEFAKRAKRLMKIAAKRGGGVDVLLTHSPPRGLGDGDDPPHHGFEALHEVIETLRPTWHLHGHIHPFGQPQPDRVVGGTTIRNVVPYKLLEIESALDPVGGHG